MTPATRWLAVRAIEGLDHLALPELATRVAATLEGHTNRDAYTAMVTVDHETQIAVSRLGRAPAYCGVSRDVSSYRAALGTECT